MFAWRAGKFGVTGLFDLKKIRTMLTPLKIQHLEGKKVTQIATGAWHSITINSAGGYECGDITAVADWSWLRNP